jgi:type III secretion system FlhB-like substrate exporter
MLKATCPKGTVLALSLDKDLSAGSKQPLESIVVAQGDGSAAGLLLSSAKANEVDVISTGDTVVAKVRFEGDQSVNGIVGAKVCP